jgi:hypothetical protein
MRNWLHEEMFSRLANQASCVLGGYDNGLVVGEGYKPNVSQFSKRVKTISLSKLSQQRPGPHYDIIFLHILPNDLEQQALIWQQLACVAQDGALLFFSAWSVDTFCEYRDQMGIVFEDMHNVGDGLAQAGWIDAVMSSQHMQVSYEYEEALSCDARIVGIEIQDLKVPMTVTYEMAFGHAVFSRAALCRQLGEFEIAAQGVGVRRS